MFYYTILKLHKTFQNRICEVQQDLFTARASLHRHAPTSREFPNKKHVVLKNGTNLCIQRTPGFDQRVTQHGSKRLNCLTFLAMVAPDRLALYLFGPFEEHRHDFTMFLESNVEEVLHELSLINHQQHYIYGDALHVLQPYIITGFNVNKFLLSKSNLRRRRCQKYAYSQRMSAKMSNITLNIQILSERERYHLFNSPFGTMERFCFVNFRVSPYGSSTSEYFGWPPQDVKTLMKVSKTGTSDKFNQ